MVKIANRARAGRGFNVRDLSGRVSTVVVLPGETRELDLADPSNPVYQGMVDAGEVEIEGMHARSAIDSDSPAGRYINLISAVTCINEHSGRQDGRDRLIDALQNGIFRAEALSYHGKRERKDRDWWARPCVCWPDERFTGLHEVKAESVWLVRSELEEWCDRLWPLQSDGAETEAVADDGAPKPKNPGGRPRKHDWEGALIFAAWFIHENGLPPQNSGGLTKALQEWFAQKGEEPAVSEIRARVRRIYEQFEATET